MSFVYFESGDPLNFVLFCFVVFLFSLMTLIFALEGELIIVLSISINSVSMLQL